MLGLLIKGIHYESHQLSFESRDHKSAHYTALNPRGQVPTLVDGDIVVTESIAILAYLDRVYPRRLLFGGNPAEAARIWQGVMEFDCYIHPPADAIVQSLLHQRWEPHAARLREGVSMVFDELDLAERSTLAEGPFTALDCMYVPLLECLQHASMKTGADKLGLQPLRLERWPKQHARLQRMRAHAGYSETYPPHWR